MRVFCLATLLAALLCAQGARAQSGAPSDCSGTVGATSAAITFPASGKTGPTAPMRYLTITNPSATAKLAINPNGAAAIDSSGSLPLDTNGAFWAWAADSGYPPPAAINIIASAGSTPYSCKYQ